MKVIAFRRTNLLVAGAARWSLTSNAIQHRRVLEICQEEVGKQPKEVAEKLRKIIAHAKEALEAGHE
jgi:hypothetical protein